MTRAREKENYVYCTAGRNKMTFPNSKCPTGGRKRERREREFPSDGWATTEQSDHKVHKLLPY